MEELKSHDDTPPPFWHSRFGIGWLVLAAVAVWFLWTEHRVHLLGALPWLVLLACPLMHVFMHRGHHGHHSSAGRRSAEEPPDQRHPGASQ